MMDNSLLVYITDQFQRGADHRSAVSENRNAIRNPTPILWVGQVLAVPCHQRVDLVNRSVPEAEFSQGLDLMAKGLSDPVCYSRGKVGTGAKSYRNDRMIDPPLAP
jgi:hypothetical protein